MRWLIGSVLSLLFMGFVLGIVLGLLCSGLGERRLKKGGGEP